MLKHLALLSLFFVCVVSASTAAPEATRDDAAHESPADQVAAEPPANEPSGPLMDIDDNITVKVTPLMPGPVIDRVTEPSTISVKAPGASSVEVYVEPVDAPYGGRSTGEPRLLGRCSTGRMFELPWTTPESARYVRIFAVAYRAQTVPTRSRGTDLGIGGRRYVAPPPPPQKAPG